MKYYDGMGKDVTEYVTALENQLEKLKAKMCDLKAKSPVEEKLAEIVEAEEKTFETVEPEERRGTAGIEVTEVGVVEDVPKPRKRSRS